MAAAGGAGAGGDAPDGPGVDAALAAAVAALGGQERDGQRRMAVAVAGAMGSGRHLLVQAGTGTGKSLAYLVPAVLHAAAGRGPVVVATATLALQRQLVERDLPRLADALAPVLGRRPTAAVLKGRRNYVCRARLETPEPDDEDAALFDTPRSALGRQARRVRQWAQATTTGDRDDFPGPVDARVWRGVSVSGRECAGRQRCRFGEECFAEQARDRARAADVVVTNHALLAIGVLEGVPVLPEHDVVVVDEGHELVDRATQAVTMELGPRAVERAAGRLGRLVDDDVADRLREAAEGLDEVLRAMAAAPGAGGRLEAVDRAQLLALASVRDAGHAAAAALAAGRADPGDPDAVARRQQARSAVEEVHDVAGRLLALTGHDVAWLDPGAPGGPVLRLAPLSVAGLLRTALFGRATAVVTSATLTLGGSFEPLAASLGLTGPDAPARTDLDVGSPFDFARQGILYVASRLPPPGRTGPSPAALDELAGLVRAAGGRTLALFSSWRAVDAAAAALAERLDGTDLPLLVQQRGDPVGELVRRFAEDPRAVLLGTLSLWQGVDVPGESCTCVVIDRIPFPRPDDPVVAARQRAAEAAGGSGFRAVAVPRAALLLAQGVGRLVRGPDDRGVVAVLDPRLATAAYGDFLRRSLPPFWYTTDGALVRAALARLDAACGTADGPGKDGSGKDGPGKDGGTAGSPAGSGGAARGAAAGGPGVPGPSARG